MKHYDIILFEASQAVNHIKDLDMIAIMFRDAGYKVAIAEVSREKEYSKAEGIDHIIFKKPCPAIYYCKGQISFTPLRALMNFINEGRYQFWLKYVICELSTMTSCIYAGSYVVTMWPVWLSVLPKSTICFFWGLRSFRMEYHKNHRSLYGLLSWRLRRIVDRNDNIKFFVSDVLIKEDFVRVGIARNRLFIRPERTTERIYESSRKASDSLSLLSIGTVRSDKRMELCMRALKQLNDPSISYTVAGATAIKDPYEGILEKESNQLPHYIRKNYRLSEEEFNQSFIESDFLFLGDIQQESLVTNGTMNEALLHGKPIIAPNYNPYKYYVKKYGIGLLYDPDKLDTLVETLKNAKKLGPEYFSCKIIEYQKLLLKDTVQSQFIETMVSTGILPAN